MPLGGELQRAPRSRGPGAVDFDDDGGVTLATQVHRRLRGDILAGDLAPGTRLRVQAAAERYSAGASPVREALNRLLAEGLVEQRDQRGFIVAPVSLEDLRELVRTRCLVEGLAFGQSIDGRTVEWEEGIVLALHRLTRVRQFVGDKVDPAWEVAHVAFHDALIANCGSRHLRRICAELRDQADRYRNLAAVVFKARDAEAEHRMMATAAIDGRRDEAVERLTTHLRKTLETIERHYAGRKP